MRALSEQQRPRTLTEALRAMPAEELAQLLALRPDLLDPVPEDVAELASRSTTSASISRAVDELNTWLRTVAEALSALPDPTSAGDLATMLGESRATVAAAVAQLRQRGLLWGADDQLHLVRPVREAFEPYPGGLAPTIGSPDVGRPDRCGRRRLRHRSSDRLGTASLVADWRRTLRRPPGQHRIGSFADRAPAQSSAAAPAGFGNRDPAAGGVMAAARWTLHRRAGSDRTSDADRPAS